MRKLNNLLINLEYHKHVLLLYKYHLLYILLLFHKFYHLNNNNNILYNIIFFILLFNFLFNYHHCIKLIFIRFYLSNKFLHFNIL